MLEGAKRASHIDPPASSYAIMRRARPYRGENPAPGKDVDGELDPTAGIREQYRHIATICQMRALRPVLGPLRIAGYRPAVGVDRTHVIAVSHRLHLPRLRAPSVQPHAVRAAGAIPGIQGVGRRPRLATMIATPEAIGDAEVVW